MRNRARAGALSLVFLALLTACGEGSVPAPTATMQMIVAVSPTSTVPQPEAPAPTVTTASSPTSAAVKEPTAPVEAPTEAPAATRDSYAKPEVLVDTAWVVEHLGDPNVKLLDVRSDGSGYQVGHLPGAIYVNPNIELTNPDDPLRAEIMTPEGLSALFSKIGIENSDTVVLYDDSSNLYAARAYWAIKYYQHENLRIYNGGAPKWVADGQPLSTDEVTVTPSEYIAAPADPDIKTSWEDVVAGIDDPETLFCDARSLDEYTGDRVQAERGGHIPGAINMDWTRAVKADGTFLDAPDLDKVYRDAGFSPNKRIITYCQIGVRGAHTWFVLHELLGYPDVRIYDGSWEEYGNREDSPIEK